MHQPAIRAAALLAFVFFAACAAAYSKPPQETRDMRMREIRQQVSAGKSQAVVYELESIVRRNPKDAEAWELLAKVYTDLDFNGNLTAKAFAAAEKAVEAAPNNSTCLKALAEQHARKGRFKEALALLDKATKQKPVDPFVYKTYALILSETKRDKEAVVYWEKFAAAKPGSNASMVQMEAGALIYARAGLTDKAVAIYDRMMELFPADTWVAKKAEAYVLGGRTKEAIDVYSKMLAKHADDEMAHLERARLYSKVGKDKEALTDMDAAIKELPTSSMYLERARIYERLGNAKMAKRDRERAASSD